METEICNIATNKLLTNSLGQEPVESLKTGQYFILNEFTNKQNFYNTIQEIILDGIAKIESYSCRQQVEIAGLGKMHEYFPVDKVALLDLFIRERIFNTTLEMAYSFGKHDLKYQDDFFIDRRLVVKINYPFPLAVKSKTTYSQYLKYGEQIDLSQEPSQSFSSTVISGQKFKSVIKKILKKTIGVNKSTQVTNSLQKEAHKNLSDAAQYHHRYPYAANSFGAHIDSWYGSALNELNLWWAIAGVNQDNGIVLYPELFGQYLEYDHNFAYLPPGITLPKPHKFDMADGNLLIFNSDVLHGSNLNISDTTRIAIAPRIVLDKPKFNPNYQSLQKQIYHSSEDIGKGDFERVVEFSMQENLGVLYKETQKSQIEKRISVIIDSPLSKQTPVALCPSNTLGVGEKMIVNFQTESVIICRTSSNLQAVGANCPHMQVSLIDGFHNDDQLYCPGHGIEFSLHNGKSKCSLLKIQVYQAYDQNGQIFLAATGCQ